MYHGSLIGTWNYLILESGSSEWRLPRPIPKGSVVLESTHSAQRDRCVPFLPAPSHFGSLKPAGVLFTAQKLASATKLDLFPSRGPTGQHLPVYPAPRPLRNLSSILRDGGRVCAPKREESGCQSYMWGWSSVLLASNQHYSPSERGRSRAKQPQETFSLWHMVFRQVPFHDEEGHTHFTTAPGSQETVPETTGGHVAETAQRPTPSSKMETQQVEDLGDKFYPFWTLNKLESKNMANYKLNMANWTYPYLAPLPPKYQKNYRERIKKVQSPPQF